MAKANDPWMKHDQCIKRFNDAAKEHNVQLASEIQFDFGKDRSRLRLPLKIEKVERSRKSVPMFFASYCPICGGKFVEGDE